MSIYDHGKENIGTKVWQTFGYYLLDISTTYEIEPKSVKFYFWTALKVFSS